MPSNRRLIKVNPRIFWLKVEVRRINHKLRISTILSKTSI
jgi:hypothetical protein